MNDSALTLIAARPRDLGGFSVRRILPAVGRKMVGPFIFFDHMGPARFAPGQGMDVRPHPHIGLATVTFLFEGAIMHRDSLGSRQAIRPGDVNWMTAGAGIVHSERTPDDLRASGGAVQGIQCWVALPKAHEEAAPTFVHHPAATLPTFDIDGVRVRLLLGDLWDRRSPVLVHSDILYLDLQMPAGSRLRIPAGRRELGAYLAAGSLRLDGQDLPEASLAVAAVSRDLELAATTASRVMIVGGEPFGEAREIWWNFVASSRARLDQAKADWAAGRFPKVPGDDEFIPLPDEPLASPQPTGTDR